MRKQVELLKHHAQLAPQGVQMLEVVVDFNAIDHDASRVMALQPIEHAQQGTLARAGGAQNSAHLAGVEVGADVAQHMVRPKVLVDLVHRDQGRVHGWRPSTS